MTIDQTHWKEATTAHGLAATALGNIYGLINGTGGVSHMTNPAEIMKSADKQYQIINLKRGKTMGQVFLCHCTIVCSNMYLHVFR